MSGELFTPQENERISNGKNKKAIQCDETYYIPGAFVVFKVEDCLFRLPSYIFANESEVFEGMFLLPQPGEALEVEVSTISDPIIISGERSEDFRSLARALYPKIPYVPWSLSTSEWLSVLKLATKWYFLRLRETAIGELERLRQLTSVEKVRYGRRYKISSWVVEGLRDLVNRDATITDDEAVELDTDTIMTAYRLYRAREQRILHGSRWDWVDSDVMYTDSVEGDFKEELDSIRADQSGYSLA